MSTHTVHNPAARPRDVQRPEPDQRPSRAGIGRIVAGSMAAGLVVAVLLVAAPIIPARAHVLTGVVLLGFAFGLALLAVVSVRVSDHPQRWAAAPAAFLTVAGLVSLLGSDTIIGHGFRWVWPQVLLGIAVWSITRARRQTPRRARRWLVYPLLAGLGLSAIGGGYETVRESIDAAAYPMPGQLIDVGGHRLHLNCTGSGSPPSSWSPATAKSPRPAPMCRPPAPCEATSTSSGRQRRRPARPRRSSTSTANR